MPHITRTNKKSFRLLAAACLALACTGVQAQAQPYFSMSSILWDSETTFLLQGARLLGYGLTANDEVSLKYRFDPASANFILAGAHVVPGAGVVLAQQNFTSADVQPAVISYTAGGASYTGDTSTRSFTSSAQAPFVASAALQSGHVISMRISNPGQPYRFEVIDGQGQVVDAFDGLPSNTVISQAHRVTQAGRYSVRVVPRGTSSSMNFGFALYNANKSAAAQLAHGSAISTSFANNLRDYYKASVVLSAGQRIELSNPGDPNVQLCLLDSLSRTKACNTGLPLSFLAQESGTYHLFILNTKGWGGGYSGRVSITQETPAPGRSARGHVEAGSAPASTGASLGRGDSD